MKVTLSAWYIVKFVGSEKSSDKELTWPILNTDCGTITIESKSVATVWLLSIASICTFIMSEISFS